MASNNGEGTESSPIHVSDDSDSENEVMEKLILPSYLSTPTLESPSDSPFSNEDPSQIAGSSSRRVEESLETAQRDQWEYVQPGRSPERGTKRQRSVSVASRRSSSYDGAPADHEGTQPATHGPPHQPPESRKAKKRRRTAEKKKEQYLLRLARLQPAQNLTPQYPPGITPMEAVNNDPFAYLPAFNQQLMNVDLPYQANFYHPEEQQIAHHTWMSMNYMQNNAMTQYEDPTLRAQWPFQPQLAHVDPFMALPSLISTTMPIDSPPASSNLDAQSAVTKPLARIGLPPDDDANSRHGLFKIPNTALDKDKKPYIPTLACTLVLENLPKTHKNHEFISNWARNACGTGANPAKVLIDGSSGKALVEFTSPEAARTAWGSPQLGAALKGLKSHLLKGKPREDLIRAYWYRVDGVSAGVGEIEEGEIEESGEKGAERKETKKEKKVRLRLEKDHRDRERQKKTRLAREAAGAGPSAAVPSTHWPVLQPPMLTNFNGLPQRPNHFPPPLSHGPVPLTLNGIPTSTVNPDGDDMDLGSPSPTNAPHADNGPIQHSNSMTLNRAAPPFIPSLGIPSEPRAMKNAPTGPTHKKRALERSREASETGQYPAGPAQPLPSLQPSAVESPRSTEAMEASLRARVLITRRTAKLSEHTPSSFGFPGPPSIPEVDTKPPAAKEPTPMLGMDDADSFIAQAVGTVSAPTPAPKPPAPSRAMPSNPVIAELVAKHQRLEQDNAERKMLMERLSNSTTKAERDAVLALLREKDRASKEDELSSAAAGPMRPSSKINLNYVPAPQPQRPYWPNPQHRTVFTISDDEDSDSEEEDDGRDL